MTQFLYYVWDVTNSQWMPHHKEEYTYNANGNLAQLLRSGWNETTNQWIIDFKYEYTYDTSGNMAQFLYYAWDETTSQWVADWKYDYTYDNSYSFSDLILPYPYYFNIILFNHMLTGIVYYDWDETSSDWVISSRDTLYYSEQNVNSVSEINGAELKVYPNPFTTSTTIEYELKHPEAIRITFYNQFGKQVDVIEVSQSQGLNKVVWTPENLLMVFIISP